LYAESNSNPLELTDAECAVAFEHLQSAAQEMGVTLSTLLKKDKKELGVVFLLRRPARSVEDLLEVRAAVVGNVDAGKSSM
jgi:GTPase